MERTARPPSVAAFVIINIALIVIALLGIIATGKYVIHIYENKVVGRGLKLLGLWVNEFELGYDDIKSVKKHKWGLTIISARGRYRIVCHNPAYCADIIQKNVFAVCKRR